MDPQQQMADRLAAQAQRPMHVFTVPAALTSVVGMKKIGMVELTGDEELLVQRRIGAEVTRIGYEMAKESLRMLDEKPVSTSDGSADRAWNQMHPKGRALVVQAYGQIHQTKREETEAFLASHTLSIE